MYHILFRMFPGRSPLESAEQLCSHEYYGGRQKMNIGGVCLLEIDGRRHLDFPYNYKAPQFTREFYGMPSLSIIAILPLLETFCRAKCNCGQVIEQEEKDKAYQKLETYLHDLIKQGVRPTRLQRHRPGYSPPSLIRVFQNGPLSPKKRSKSIQTLFSITACTQKPN
jgi:hypothetical protein